MFGIVKFTRHYFKKYIYIKSKNDAYRYYKKNIINHGMYTKDKTEKNRVHVLVNGPSLNKTISIIGDGEDVITVNEAFRDSKIKALKPKFHVLIDPEYAADVDALKEIKDCLDNGIINTLVINPCIYCAWRKLYSDQNVRVVNQVSTEEPYLSCRDKKNYERNLMTPYFQTVAIAAIYIGIQEGYSEILLHGNDFDFIHNLIVDKNNQLFLRDTHFYETTMLRMPYDLETFLEAYIKMLKGYNQVAQYAIDEGVKIKNMCPESLLYMFEK